MMHFSAVDILAAALVAGILNLDRVQVGCFMLARPIVTAPLVGAVFGETALGLWIGASMELIWLTVLPIGNFVPPDSQVAAAAGTIAAAVWLQGSQDFTTKVCVTMLAIIFAVPVGALARTADRKIRERSEKIASYAQTVIESGREVHTSLLILQAIGETFVKGTALTLGAGALAVLLTPVVEWLLDVTRICDGLWLAQFALPVVGLAFLMEVLGIRERWYYFVIGLAAVLVGKGLLITGVINL